MFIFLSLLLMGPANGIDKGQAEQVQATSDGWIVERTSWEGVIEPGTRLELKNPYGDIRARSTPDKVVTLSAMVQKQESDQQQIELQIQKDAGRLVIATIYKGDEADTIKKGGKRRVDVTIYVPHGSAFSAETHKGLIEAKGLKSDVTFNSFGGRIYLRIEGHAVVKTYQGNIEAVLKKTEWAEPTRLESTLGEISVYLPANANVLAEIETSGLITTDYTIYIEDHSGIKKATAQLGEGKYGLKIKNQTGSTKILKGRWDVE